MKNNYISTIVGIILFISCLFSNIKTIYCQQTSNYKFYEQTNFEFCNQKKKDVRKVDSLQLLDNNKEKIDMRIPIIVGLITGGAFVVAVQLKNKDRSEKEKVFAKPLGYIVGFPLGFALGFLISGAILEAKIKNKKDKNSCLKIINNMKISYKMTYLGNRQCFIEYRYYF